MNKEENVCEQEAQSPQAAEAEKEKGGTDLGKFKDVNALLEAYGALQAEFTRRSQRLRALEKEAENSAVEEDPSKAKERYVAPQAQSEGAGNAQAPAISTAPQPADAETYVKKAAYSEEELYAEATKNEGVRLKIIGEYLSSLKKGDAPVSRGGAGMPAVSPVKAKSLEDAANMALHFFKNGNGA